MKMKFKRISKSTLSVILAMMMLVSTMLVGTMSVIAAEDNNFKTGSTIYFKPSEAWADAGAKFAAYFNWSNGSPAQWIGLFDNDSDGIYSGTVPGNSGDSYKQVKFYRLSNSVLDTTLSAGGTSEPNDIWARFDVYLAPTNGENYCKMTATGITNWGQSVVWSTYSDDIDPSNVTYRLNGASTITGKSSNVEKYADSADFTTVNGTTYETTITYTHDSTNNFFSIVGSDGRYYDPANTYYDPANTDSVNATNGCSNVEVFPNTTKSGRNFYFTESGTYKITLDASGTNPKVTVEKASSWFVHGNFIDANNHYKDYNFVNNSVSIPLLASKTYRFKIANGTTYYGNNGQMSSNCSGWEFYTNADECTITTTIAGDYVFNVDTSGTEPKLSVTYPTGGTGGGGDSTWILYDGTDSDNNNLGAFSKPADSSIFELTCELTKDREYHLYIYNSETKTYWRMGDSVKFDDANLSQDLVLYGSNVPDHCISFTPEVTGTYTFTWVVNGNRGTLSVAYPEDSSPHTVIFGMNDGTLGSVTATNTVTGENISSSSSVPSGTSVKFTARPNEGYKVEGWYSDIACTNLISGTTNAKSYTKVIRTDANVYVKFVERVPIITTIYAKNCSYNVDNSGVVGLNYGDTILVDADGRAIDSTSTDDIHKYKTYSIMSDTEVTISTTVDSAHYKAGKGYYVAGFVVNGETVSIINTKPNTDGSCTYSGYYKVEDSEKIEITPVYFNKTIEENEDYVYFTVEADDVHANWGNTTAAYSYYYYYVDGIRHQYEQDGTWPGQPLLKTKTGVYWTMVSKYYYDEDSNKIDYAMSGVVFSNYGADYVHKEQLGFGFCQTYDYNTPVVAIANGYDTISFATRYRNKTNNLATVNSDFNPDSYKNGWDIVWDYNHSKIVDIIGNEVVDATKDPIYVVSTGPNPIDDVAEYAAVWHVYAKTSNGYKKITSGLPSTFINPDSEQYKAMNTEEYIGRPTYISYEKINDNRIDGRWHYSKQAELEIPVYLQAQYLDDTDNWVYDKKGVAGTATIDDATPDINGISSKIFHIGEKANILAAPKNGYQFEGWYLVDTQSSENANDFTFTRLDTIIDPSADIIINRSMYLVARFKPVPEGELALSHNPFPKSGLGYYSIKAVVRDSDGSVKGTYESSSSVSFPITANYSIEITLSTRAAGINVFDGWYSDENGEYYPLATYPADENKGASFDGKVYKYTFTQKAADLFDDDKLLKNTMNFYSKITEVSSTATLNYQYDDRFGGLKTYTKTVQLSAQFLEDNGYDMSKTDGQTIIMENAPAIEDLYKNFKWEITEQNVNYSGTTVTLKAINLEKTYSLSIKDGNVPAEVYAKKIKYNSLMDGAEKTEDNPHGFKIKAKDEDSNGNAFSYWIVTKTDDPENREVSRTYSKYFNLRIVDDYTITAIYGSDEDKNASISDPTYTREQYTDNGKDFDYLYADFVLSYTSKDGAIIREDPTRYNTGIILEFDKNITIGLLAEGEEVSFEGKTFDTTDEKIKYAINMIDSGKFETYDSDGDGTKNRAIYNYKIDSSLYNNMNRVDYYLRFNNTPNFQNYVMKAYFYVVDTETDETTISAPVYFNLYKIGTSEPNKG